MNDHSESLDALLRMCETIAHDAMMVLSGIINNPVAKTNEKLRAVALVNSLRMELHDRLELARRVDEAELVASRLENGSE